MHEVARVAQVCLPAYLPLIMSAAAASCKCGFAQRNSTEATAAVAATDPLDP